MSDMLLEAMGEQLTVVYGRVFPLMLPSVIPYDEAHEFRMTEVVMDRPSMRGFEGMPSTPALPSAALTPVASAEVPA